MEDINTKVAVLEEQHKSQQAEINEFKVIVKEGFADLKKTLSNGLSSRMRELETGQAAMKAAVKAKEDNTRLIMYIGFGIIGAAIAIIRFFT